MRSKYTNNSTFGRKVVTGNGFSDADFLYCTNISPLNQRMRVNHFWLRQRKKHGTRICPTHAVSWTIIQTSTVQGHPGSKTPIAGLLSNLL